MEVEAAALFGFEPSLNVRASVRAIVIEDEVDLQIGWHFLLALVKELNEFLPMMTWQTASDDLPVQDVASRKKCVRPIPLVVVGLAFGQQGSDPVQGLNLAFFVHTKDLGTIGRLQVQTHDITHLTLRTSDLWRS